LTPFLLKNRQTLPTAKPKAIKLYLVSEFLEPLLPFTFFWCLIYFLEDIFLEPFIFFVQKISNSLQFPVEGIQV